MSCGWRKKQKVVLYPKAFLPDPLACWRVFLGSSSASASPVSLLAKRKPNSDWASGSLPRCGGRVKSEGGHFPQDSGNCGENAKQRQLVGQEVVGRRDGPADPGLTDKVSSPTPLHPHLPTPIYPLGSTHPREPPSHFLFPPPHWHKNSKIRMQQAG